ncbi:cation-transporting P-type ATPase [Clostridium taeniosporum]|uniref:ATPase n=1 Tax=Clostridium taeniosporum TaxID=394958 RepID=A0A1D7XI32_9CLOT|nr:cation-transporting P-type ATPase [Clostridium taeniosporum]AOR22966.1 ATPase [Clostridium taeniosporum]
MDKYCNNTWIQVVEMLESNAQRGLSSSECEARKNKYGTNKIGLPNGNRLSKNILGVFKQIHILIYFIITILLFIINFNNFKFVVLGFLIINIVALMYYNIRKDKEIGFLEKLNFATATVIRDGVQQIIKVEDILIGDIVVFKKDSLIPADIRIIKANNIKVDEKNITGEGFLKEKFESKISGGINSLSEMNNILFKGSVIKEGSGEGIVISIGNSTQLGRLLAMLTYASNRKNTLLNKVQKQWGKYLLYSFFMLIFGIIAVDLVKKDIGYLYNGFIIIGCLPIILIITLAVKYILQLFLKQDINIINFSTFDLINDINIMCLDKIGGITQEKMIVKKIFTSNEIFFAEDIKYTKDINTTRILDISLLCNNGIYNDEEENKGELEEIAYLEYAAKKKVYKSDLDKQNFRIIEIPMDFDKRMITVVNKIKRWYRANSRGNLDSILDRCTHIMIDGVEKEFTAEEKAKVKNIDIKFSAQGLITQAFAYRNFSYQPSTDENIESNMVFVGIIALENPLKDDIEDRVNKIKNSGIIPILFTEENKISAITTAKKARFIYKNEQVVSGIELDTLNSQELKDLLHKVRVFSRINPEIKSQIIALFNKDGYKISATGETLGDLPSLNLSNVGIAKGQPSLLVKKISDVYIKENYLDGFFKIKDYATKLSHNINRAFKGIYTLVLTQIITLFLSLMSEINQPLDISNILYTNIILSIPISLILLLKNGKNISGKEVVLRSILLSSIIFISTYILKDSSRYFISFLTISLGGIIFASFNSGISLRVSSIERKLMVISIILSIMFLGLIFMLKQIIITNNLMIISAIIIVSLIIFEILFKKWQNSLMR